MQVIGHRGARGLFPENTLEGFRAAATLGINRFELDVGMTADGAVVVCHDPALNPNLTRDSSGGWIASPGPLIRSLTLAALSTYDVGRIRPASLTACRFAKQMPHDGARVPTLAAVLGALPEVHFVIEVKTDPTHPDQTAGPDELADAVLAVVDRAGAIDRVVIESFDWRVQHHIRNSWPEIRLAWLTRAETVRRAALWWAGVQPLDHRGSIPDCVAQASGSPSAGGDAWAAAHQDLTEAQVRRAHDLGLDVLPWTVNRPGHMRRLIGWGVDGMISDRPDVVAAVLAARP